MKIGLNLNYITIELKIWFQVKIDNRVRIGTHRSRSIGSKSIKSGQTWNLNINNSEYCFTLPFRHLL